MLRQAITSEQEVVACYETIVLEDKSSQVVLDETRAAEHVRGCMNNIKRPLRKVYITFVFTIVINLYVPMHAQLPINHAAADDQVRTAGRYVKVCLSSYSRHPHWYQKLLKSKYINVYF